MYILEDTRMALLISFYQNLKRREKLGELILLDINEFRTSVVSVILLF
jgi:hypothetical protein